MIRRLLFITAHRYLPDRDGGSERVTHDLCSALQRRGIAVAVLADTASDDWICWPDDSQRQDCGFWGYRDEVMSYPVYRRRDPIGAVAEVVADFVPSAAVIMAGIPLSAAQACIAAGVPTVVYFHDVNFDELLRPGETVSAFPWKEPGLAYLANSRFTAARYAARFGVTAPVVEPIVASDDYRTETIRKTVLFVNPIPAKGVTTAFALAVARPDIPFEFIESWPLGDDEFAALVERCHICGNVTLHRRTPDIRTVYARAKLLLVPSLWQEAWARVVTEAQASGIPVLASRIGGLPESVGPGGILVDPASDLAAWRDALAQLWDDPATYGRYADAALAHSRRRETQPDELVDKFLAAVDAQAAQVTPRPAVSAGAVRLDIVVPTHKRPDDLDWLLGRLREQVEGHPSRRIVVVNDGSDDPRYQAVVARHRDIAEYLVLAQNRGPAAARNAGAARATGDWLVFIDDDCEPPPYWLDWICAAIVANHDADAIGGTTCPLPSSLRRFVPRLVADGGFFPQPVVRNGRLLMLVTANLAVRRSAFAAVGGFDESMITTEDRNLTYRLGRGGAVLHFDPGWFVYHDMTGSLRSHFRRYYRYGVGNGRELALEGDAPDRERWPATPGDALYWWRRSAALWTRAGDRKLPRHGTLRTWLARVLALATYLVMDWGFVRGDRRRPQAL